MKKKFTSSINKYVKISKFYLRSILGIAKQTLSPLRKKIERIESIIDAAKPNTYNSQIKKMQRNKDE